MTLARDVAKELDKRQRRRKLLFLAVVVALIVAAVLYLRCGAGWGLGGGKGKGEGGKGSAAAVSDDAGAKRCVLRVDATGISLAGEPATLDAAVTACKAAGGAEVRVIGDATQGVWDDLRAALDAAGVPTLLQEK